jgi:hypothetical protein
MGTDAAPPPPPPDNGGNPGDIGGPPAPAPASAPASAPAAAPAPGGAAGSSSTGSGSLGTTAGTAGGTNGGGHYKGGKHAAKNKSVKGTVASVDQTAKSFVVHPAKGADVTLKVNDKTKYTPKGKGWDDIKADEHVSATYKNDGTDNWAVTVHVGGGKKAAAAPAAAKTTGR